MNDIPSVPQTHVKDPLLAPIIDAIRQVFQTRAYGQDELKKWVTWQDLLEQGIVRQTLNGQIVDPGGGGNNGGGTGFIPVDPGSDPLDTTPPPAPTALSATGGQFAVYLTWSMGAVVTVAYYEVWRATADDLSSATLIGTSTAQSYADVVPTTSTYYYWVRAVSKADITGAFNATAGTAGAVSFDPEEILSALTNVVFEDDLTAAIATRTKTFWQTTPPTAQSVGDLWFDSDDNNLMYRWNGTAWVATPDGRIATLQTQVTSLTSTGGGNTTNITALQNTVNGLSAQYTVKIDNNGYVSGFGLASDATNGIPISSFNILSNRFALLQPSGPRTVTSLTRSGTTATAVIGAGHSVVQGQFFVINHSADYGWNGTWQATGTTTTSVVFTVPNTLTSSPGIVGGRTAITLTPVMVPFVVDSGLTVIDGALIKTASIKDASIGSLTADKITAGYINAAIGMTGAKIHGAEIYGGGTVAVVRDSNQVFQNFTVSNPNYKLTNSTVEFVVDSFKIRNIVASSGTLYTPFFLDGSGVVYLDSARIRNGDIVNAKIGNVIQSNNYVAGTSGWIINKDGTAEFRNIIARGNIQATSLNAATGTFTGQLSAATGTFAGALSAATGTFAGALQAASGSFSGALVAASGTFSGSLTAFAVNAVDTINLAGQAVTFAVDAYTAGDITPTAISDGYVTVQSVVIPNPSGAPIFVLVNVAARGTSGLYRVVAAQGGSPNILRGSGIQGSGLVTIAARIVAPTPGVALTISFTVLGFSVTPVLVISDRYMYAQETKR